MKALFIGLGSVGQRHLANYKNIMGEKSEITVFRETNHNLLIENCEVTQCDSLSEHYGFKQAESLEDALAAGQDAVFITNPSSKHFDAALKALQHDCNVFVEKPLSHTLKNLHLLKEEAERRKLIVMVGYQTRFNPCYRFVREILSEKKYGRIISAHFEWGTYLPGHHPYADYRTGYAAQKDLGGGVILGLSHEIDLIYSLFGQPEKVYSIGGKLSALEMEVEDTVSVLMGFDQNKKTFPVTLCLSYAQTKEAHRFRIQLEEATIMCDFSENSVEVFGKSGETITANSYADLDRNALFMDEMKEFISSIEEKRQPTVNLDDGMESLKLAFKIKDCIDEKS